MIKYWHILHNNLNLNQNNRRKFKKGREYSPQKTNKMRTKYYRRHVGKNSKKKLKSRNNKKKIEK